LKKRLLTSKAVPGIEHKISQFNEKNKLLEPKNIEIKSDFGFGKLIHKLR